MGHQKVSQERSFFCAVCWIGKLVLVEITLGSPARFPFHVLVGGSICSVSGQLFCRVKSWLKHQQFLYLKKTLIISQCGASTLSSMFLSIFTYRYGINIFTYFLLNFIITILDEIQILRVATKSHLYHYLLKIRIIENFRSSVQHLYQFTLIFASITIVHVFQLLLWGQDLKKRKTVRRKEVVSLFPKNTDAGQQEGVCSFVVWSTKSSIQDAWREKPVLTQNHHKRAEMLSIFQQENREKTSF